MKPICLYFMFSLIISKKNAAVDSNSNKKKIEIILYMTVFFFFNFDL